MRAWTWAKLHPWWAAILVIVLLYLLLFILTTVTGHGSYPPVKTGG